MKQKIAAEMNLSETAFVIPIDEKRDFEKSVKFELRWFTPTTEVPLCGHATLASATVLFYVKNNENVSNVCSAMPVCNVHCALCRHRSLA